MGKMNISKPTGKLGILLPGMGAVATTFIAGVIAANKGLAQPIGSLTQMGRLRVGKRTKSINKKLYGEVIPIQNLKNVVFGGWDIYKDNMYEAAVNAEVLDSDMLRKLKTPLSKI